MILPLYNNDLYKSVLSLKEFGFVHGDIHAKNIMKKPNGSYILIDYGLGSSEYKNREIKSLDEALRRLNHAYRHLG